jgi:hypothetical protein
LEGAFFVNFQPNKKEDFMADEATESGSEQAVQGVPTPTIASTSNDKPTSENGLDVVLKRLEKLEREGQSRHDKRVNRLERDIDSLRETLSTYGVKGPEVDAALGRMEYDDLKQQVRELASSNGTGTTEKPKAPQSNLAEQTADILKTAGIDPFDPEVVELSQKPYASEFEWLKTVTSLAVSRANKTVADTPPPSGVINDGRAKPAVVVDKEGQLNTLYARLEELSSNPVTNAIERASVKAKIRELGGEL